MNRSSGGGGGRGGGGRQRRGRKRRSSNTATNNHSHNNNATGSTRTTAVVATAHAATRSRNTAAVGGVSSNNNAQNARTYCTTRAVEKMILAEPYQGPLRVFVNAATTSAPSADDQYCVAQVCDDSHYATVIVSLAHNDNSLWQQRQQRTTRGNHHHHWKMVEIKGYVTSTVNALGGPSQPAFQPFLCLTEFEVIAAPSSLSRQSWNQIMRGKQAPLMNNNNNNNNKVKGGTSAKFLMENLEFLTNVDLMGLSRMRGFYSTSSGPSFQQQEPQHERDFDQNQSSVHEFLTHHKAMKTLQESKMMIHHSSSSVASSSSTTGAAAGNQNNDPNGSNSSSIGNDMEEDDNDNNSNNNNMQNDASSSSQVPAQQQQQQQQQHELYFAALREFSSSQIDRQNASLTSNAGRATASDAAKVVTQYKETLTRVLEAASATTTPSQPWITQQSLQQWHGILCGNGLHARAGQFRTNTVKAGRTVFLPADQVADNLEFCLLPVLHVLQQRLSESQGSSPVACLTYAAAVFFGIVDLHMFGDGNGRLARLLGNGALKALGLPFCINWFATPAQRREYVLALITTRRNLTLVYRGGVEEEKSASNQAAMVRSVLPATGLFFPLVALLMDRVRKCLPELVQMQKDKHLSAMEHEEARAARRARERAAAGSCLICFDERPNIATLCCGKAVHLSCIAEWLASNASCPNCRGNFPALPRRPAPRSSNFNPGGSDDSVSDEDDEDEDDEDDTIGIDLFEGTTTDAMSGEDSTLDDEDDTSEMVPQGLLNLLQLQPHHPHQDGTDEDAAIEIDDSTDVFDDDDEDDDTDEVVVVSHANQQDPPEDDDDDDDTTDDTEEVVVQNHNLHNNSDPDDTTEELDDTTTEEMVNADDTTDAIENDNTTASDDDDTDSTVDHAPANNQQGPPIVFCNQCGRNRAALECTNSCCGRCCMMHGLYGCSRHGT